MAANGSFKVVRGGQIWTWNTIFFFNCSEQLERNLSILLEITRTEHEVVVTGSSLDRSKLLVFLPFFSSSMDFFANPVVPWRKVFPDVVVGIGIYISHRQRHCSDPAQKWSRTYNCVVMCTNKALGGVWTSSWCFKLLVWASEWWTRGLE